MTACSPPIEVLIIISTFHTQEHAKEVLELSEGYDVSMLLPSVGWLQFISVIDFRDPMKFTEALSNLKNKVNVAAQEDKLRTVRNLPEKAHYCPLNCCLQTRPSLHV